MNAVTTEIIPESGRATRYARCVTQSKKVEWQIDRDLPRGRSFDFSRKFLPDGLTLIDRLRFLSGDEARLLNQIQGRTYAYIFGLVERFISAKMLDLGRLPSKGWCDFPTRKSNTRSCSVAWRR